MNWLLQCLGERKADSDTGGSSRSSIAGEEVSRICERFVLEHEIEKTVEIYYAWRIKNILKTGG